MTDYQDFTTKDMPKAEREKLNVGDIWANEIQCLRCMDFVRSTHRHDFRRCSCGAAAVDGGSWYSKITGDIDEIRWLTEMYDDC